MNPTMRRFVDEAFHDDPRVDVAEQRLRFKLHPMIEGEHSDTLKEVVEVAIKESCRRYVLEHRSDPIRSITIREVDKRFTPQRLTEEQQEEHERTMRERVFEHRMPNDESVWKTKKEVLEPYVRARKLLEKRMVVRTNILDLMCQRMGPDQTPEEAGITNEEVEAFKKESLEAAGKGFSVNDSLITRMVRGAI